MSTLSVFGDIYQSTNFKFTYNSRADCVLYPSCFTIWQEIIKTRYDGRVQKFLDEIYNVFNKAYNDIDVDKDTFNIIIQFCESEVALTSIDNMTKSNILSTLYCTNEAHEGREWSYRVLSPNHKKWYAANKDMIENYSPMLLFEFIIPVTILEYSLKSANDCPFRDPYHWYLFGIFGDELNVNNEIVILHEYDGNEDGNKRKVWRYNERWKVERFEINDDINEHEYRFKYIGLKIISGRRNKWDIQLGQIQFKIKL